MTLIIAIVIVVIVVFVYFFAIPGIFLVRGRDLKGYWSDLHGIVYKFIPVKNKLISLQISNGDNITYAKINGTIFKSTITIFNENMAKIKNGVYDSKSKTFLFNNGEEYTKLLYHKK